jgi:hypothetical protein
MPESKDMTLMPLLIAFLVMGMRASRSFAEMAMPWTFWAMRESMISIWPSAVGVDGPW